MSQSGSFPIPQAPLDAYAQAELEIVRDISDPRRRVPAVRATDRVVLDIGCGSGQTLTAQEFSAVREKYGIDIDADAVSRGRAAFPEMHLSVARAEALPFATGTFDLVFSRVAWPYVDIPVAAAEAYRVLKPDGRIWLAMHPWTMERERIRDALQRRRLLSLASRAPVLANSVAQHLLGAPLPLPKFITRETFQTARGMKAMLSRAGFADITVTETPTLIVTARRP